MAEWSRDKVEPQDINGGQEFTPNSDLTIEELIAMVNNSFYGVDFVEGMTEQPIVDNSNPDAEMEVKLVPYVKDGKTYYRFKFINAKGKQGIQGVQGEKGDGTLIYINNQLQERVDFSNNPQEQLNSKSLIFNPSNDIIVPDGISNLNELYNWLNSNEPEKHTFSNSIGIQQNSSLKNIFGNPNGFANYTECYIRLIKMFELNSNRFGVYEIFAQGNWISKFAHAYLYSYSNEADWTGWQILK